MKGQLHIRPRYPPPPPVLNLTDTVSDKEQRGVSRSDNGGSNSRRKYVRQPFQQPFVSLLGRMSVHRSHWRKKASANHPGAGEGGGGVRMFALSQTALIPPHIMCHAYLIVQEPPEAIEQEG